MKNVLLVSYYVPPRSGIATTRTRQLLKYLPQFGWNVTAVTAQLDGAASDVIQTRYLDIRESIKQAIGLRGGTVTHEALGAKLAAHDVKRSFRQRLIETAFHLTNYPDAQAGWYFSGTKPLRSLIASGKYDAVLSSSPPFTTNCMIASALYHALRPIPWIADFRDLWMENDLHRSSTFRRFLDDKLEQWSLRKVTALTTVSLPLADTLRKRYQSVPVYEITNAFDASEWEPIPFETSERCTFLYAGELSSGRRDPRPLFRVLRKLLDQQAITENDVSVDLYSGREGWLEDMIAEYGLGNVVRIHGLMPRNIVLSAERRANRLLVLLWSGIGSEGILTGKLFEYLGARRRIIALGGPPNSAVDAVLSTTQSGERFLDDTLLEQEIRSAILEHRTRQVAIVPVPATLPFEASGLARRFAEVLDTVAAVA